MAKLTAPPWNSQCEARRALFPIKDNLAAERLPIVTILLIVASVLVYFVLQHGGFGGAPDDVLLADRDAVTLAGSLFMHDGIVHLLCSVLFLWLFGGTVEDSMSRPRFALLYLFGALASLGVQVLVDPDATLRAIGASGAVAAVLAGYIALYPRGRVLTVVFFPFASTMVELPAWLLLGAFFAVQAIVDAASLGGTGGGAAYLGLAGGFVVGLVAVRLLAHRRKQLPARVGELLT